MKTNIKLFVAVAILLRVQHLAEGQGCSFFTGPAGGLHCACFPSIYDDCQWATCLSKSYIEQKSRNQHTCRTRWALYCYYQCQLEEYDLDEGAVFDKCKCNEGDPPPTPAPNGNDNNNNDQLNISCLSPDGTKCNWYRECLEKKYPCGSGNGYALNYAEKFCNLYNSRASYFSPQGQRWINAVRKCLQVALVPLLRPWESPSCDEIKARAFASHSPCYLQPFPNEPSICDLNCFDWAQVVWTIKGGFTDVFVVLYIY